MIRLALKPSAAPHIHTLATSLVATHTAPNRPQWSPREQGLPGAPQFVTVHNCAEDMRTWERNTNQANRSTTGSQQSSESDI